MILKRKKMKSSARLCLTILVPYVIGILVSSKILPLNYFHDDVDDEEFLSSTGQGQKMNMFDEHKGSGIETMGQKGIKEYFQGINPFDGVTFVVHRNGEADSCGQTADGDGVDVLDGEYDY